MCGGTRRHSAAAFSGGGLSPRVRGNRLLGIAIAIAIGSIPACAGEPIINAAEYAKIKVYPRVCGGTSGCSWPCSSWEGLSPRVRGNHLVAVSGGAVRRSIPACAGEPRQAGGKQSHDEVYPRVCGGTRASPERRSERRGLSPRVRGNRRRPRRPAPSDRSIPACAGEPVTRRNALIDPKVYPRVCGGTPAGERARRLLAGLSPRVRGNPATSRGRPATPGSIPACAGEPPMTRCWGCAAGVYPRVCGGTPVGQI